MTVIMMLKVECFLENGTTSQRYAHPTCALWWGIGGHGYLEKGFMVWDFFCIYSSPQTDRKVNPHRILWWFIRFWLVQRIFTTVLLGKIIRKCWTFRCVRFSLRRSDGGVLQLWRPQCWVCQIVLRNPLVIRDSHGTLAHLDPLGGFHKWGYPNSWMAYNRKSHWKGMI